jgi:hypothetical protein
MFDCRLVEGRELISGGKCEVVECLCLDRPQEERIREITVFMFNFNIFSGKATREEKYTIHTS